MQECYNMRARASILRAKCCRRCSCCNTLRNCPTNRLIKPIRCVYIFKRTFYLCCRLTFCIPQECHNFCTSTCFTRCKFISLYTGSNIFRYSLLYRLIIPIGFLHIFKWIIRIYARSASCIP